MVLLCINQVKPTYAHLTENDVCPYPCENEPVTWEQKLVMHMIRTSVPAMDKDARKDMVKFAKAGYKPGQCDIVDGKRKQKYSFKAAASNKCIKAEEKVYVDGLSLD